MRCVLHPFTQPLPQLQPQPLSSISLHSSPTSHLQFHMCRTRMAISATDPSQSPAHRPRTTQSPRATPSQRQPTSSSSSAAFAFPSSSSSSDPSTSSAPNTTTSSSTLSSRTSLSSLRQSLSQNPHIYDISEIRTATNNFLAKRHSSSSSAACWRCNLRNTNTIVFQRKFRRKIETSQLKQRLSVICRSHHTSVNKLLGASISGDHIYLVYDFINGANLADCLRNSKNPNFTVLSTWMSRMQVATDMAFGLDYIHNKTGLNISLVHNHIKSSSIIVTEPLFNAKICHFGTAQLCGEVEDEDVSVWEGKKKKDKSETNETSSGEEDEETEEEKSTSFRKRLERSRSGERQFEGVRGYMSPEYLATAIATQKADVYAFGVVILELLSGEEPFKYRYDKMGGNFVRTSVMETARTAIGDDAGGREARLRKWVDGRLKDSFPVGVAEKLTRVALDCVHVDPDKRPDMGRVAGKFSKWYIESGIWADSFKISDQISVSLAAR